MSESTHCWQCGKRLNKHPQTGALIYEVVWMPLGTISVRVHKTCKPDALLFLHPNTRTEAPDEDGRTEPKRVQG